MYARRATQPAQGTCSTISSVTAVSFIKSPRIGTNASTAKAIRRKLEPTIFPPLPPPHPYPPHPPRYRSYPCPTTVHLFVASATLNSFPGCYYSSISRSRACSTFRESLFDANVALSESWPFVSLREICERVSGERKFGTLQLEGGDCLNRRCFRSSSNLVLNFVDEL